MITVRFACGHVASKKAEETGTTPPVCGECGETRVARVKAPAPTFRGAAKGPCAVETK